MMRMMATTTPMTMPTMAPVSKLLFLLPPPLSVLIPEITVVVGLGVTVTVTVGGAFCRGRRAARGRGRVFVGAMVG